MGIEKFTTNGEEVEVRNPKPGQEDEGRMELVEAAKEAHMLKEIVSDNRDSNVDFEGKYNADGDEVTPITPEEYAEADAYLEKVKNMAKKEADPSLIKKAIIALVRIKMRLAYALNIIDSGSKRSIEYNDRVDANAQFEREKLRLEEMLTKYTVELKNLEADAQE